MNQIIERALKSFQHFEKFESSIEEARRQLRYSRDLQRINGSLTHLPEYENELVYDIYDKIREIQQIIEQLKEGEPDHEANV